MNNLANRDIFPVAPLKIIAMDNYAQRGKVISDIISASRKKSVVNQQMKKQMGYIEDDYLTPYHMITHHTGERRAIIDDEIRGTDLFIIADVVNRYQKYELGKKGLNITPDEHFLDIKRLVSACHGSAHRISIVMPYLYEGRYNNRKRTESLDCAVALRDLFQMGISNIITFDAHEPRIQNAVPIQGIDIFPTSYQFIQTLINSRDGLHFDKDSLLIVSPDVGGMNRVVFYSTIMEVNMGMFYRRKDYSVLKDGKNPVVAVEFLGSDCKGKDIIIVDDMIDSGSTLINTAIELKSRGANKIIFVATFGLFTHGLEQFDKAYANGLFNKLYTTNLTYVSDDLLNKPYYRMVDMNGEIADIIDKLNHDVSFVEHTDQSAQIKELLDTVR